MLLEGKVKKVALLTAVDISLKTSKNSSKRCARNIIELGLSAYPNKLSANDQDILFQQLLDAFEEDDIAKARDLFTSAFLQ